MIAQFKKFGARHSEEPPLHYTACGLDDVYLINGFRRETIDGEELITIEDMDGLWKAIGMHLIIRRKVLAPKEIRFLRAHMGLTRAELGTQLRVSDQTVARWEKGAAAIDGPADFMLRILFLTYDHAQPEGVQILAKIRQILDDIVRRNDDVLAEIRQILDDIVRRDDDGRNTKMGFRHNRKKWSEETLMAA